MIQDNIQDGVLLAGGARLNVVTNEDDSPLSIAVNCKNADMVRLFAGRKDCMLNTMDRRTGWGPLHLAASLGNVEIVKVLLDAGADPRRMLSSGSALHVAAASNHVEVIYTLLVGGANVDQLDDCGCTALHYAAQSGHASIADYLLRAGAHINARQNQGATALYIATYFQRHGVIGTLLAHGADVTICDQAGWSPLDVSRQMKDWQSARLLEDALAAKMATERVIANTRYGN